MPAPPKIRSPPGASGHRVVVAAAVHLVRALAGLHGVVSGVAAHEVRAAAALEAVVPGEPAHLIPAVGALQPVVARRTVHDGGQGDAAQHEQRYRRDRE